MASEFPARHLACLVLSNPSLVTEARQVIRDGGGDQDAFLGARRLIENAWDGGERLPDGRDYTRAAGLLADLAHPAEARLLTAVASTERQLAAAAARWEHRYDGWTDPVAVRIPAGLLDLEPGQRGIDGALYQAGRYNTQSGLYGIPVLLVRTRAACELMTGWDDLAQPREWLRGRLPAARGPLQSPPAPAVLRTTREEQVLAFVLRYPWEVDAVGQAIPGYRFISDVRDEILAAASVISWRGGTIDAETVALELGRRYAWAPAWARHALGGPGAPWAAAYVRRLAATEVSPALAHQAIRELAPLCATPGLNRHLPVTSPRHQAVLPAERPSAVPQVIPPGQAPRM